MDKTPSRKKFLQLLGLSTGVAVAGASALVQGINKADIRMLTSTQQEFMDRYNKWIDEYIAAIRIQKADPDNIENHKTLAALSHKAEAFKPELAGFMQDQTFVLFFNVAIERMTKEI